MNANFSEDLNTIKAQLVKLTEGLLHANEYLLKALNNCEDELFEQAKGCITNVSSKINDIDNDIVKVLALYNPEAKDLRQVVSYFKITNEILRASSSTRSFIKGFTELCSDMDIELINEYAIPMQTSTVKAVKLMVDMMNMDCVDELQETYNSALIEENKTDDLYEMVEKSILKQAQEADDFEKYHNMLRTLRKSEKIADRAISIASLLVYVKVGGTLYRN